MTSAPASRADNVYSAIQEIPGMGYFSAPLREFERVAIEPLPGLDTFLVHWSTLLNKLESNPERPNRYYREDQWLQEATLRTQGAAGLAEVARRSQRWNDLDAWCRALTGSGDWKAARSAFEEAAELVQDSTNHRGSFLDGVCLAAQQLSSDDLGAALERAWRAAPTFIRLRRWLGHCSTPEQLATCAESAINVPPANAARQRALLHVIRGDPCAASKLLASAPGLGWSSEEHPGHLMFPLLVALLGETEIAIELPLTYVDSQPLDRDQPKLLTPTVNAVLRLIDLRGPSDEKVRSHLSMALRTAVEKRVLGVIKNKRRRYYEQVAKLAVQCARTDPNHGAVWLRKLVNDYRRYYALMREF